MASIEQRGDSYRVVWRYDGQKQYTTWPSEKLAEQANELAKAHRHRITDDQVYAIILGEEPEEEAPTTPTLRAWCERWLPSKTRLGPGTLARYRQQLRDHIYPWFGEDTPIGDIDAVMIGTWLNHMREVMGSTKTVTRYYSLLHSALEAAVRQRQMQFNPCKEVDFVRDQVADDDTGEHRAVYLTPAQYELLRAAFAAKWHTLLDCIVETGMRWGEVTALATKHLVASTDKTPPRIHVWRAWKRGEKADVYLGTTKGRSKRTLPIGEDLYKALWKLVADKTDETLIFRDAVGDALDYSETYNDIWRPALLRARRCVEHPPPNQGKQRENARGRCRDYGGVTQAGRPCGARVVPGTTRCNSHYGPAPGAVSTCECPGVLRVTPSWHDLRHTHAAWLFSDPRMTPLAISRRLGHATLATTSEIYGDLMPQAAEAAVDAIADARKAGREG